MEVAESNFSHTQSSVRTLRKVKMISWKSLPPGVPTDEQTAS